MIFAQEPRERQTVPCEIFGHGLRTIETQRFIPRYARVVVTTLAEANELRSKGYNLLSYQPGAGEQVQP